MLSKRAMRGRKDRQIDEERLTGKAGQLDDALHTHARAKCAQLLFSAPLFHMKVGTFFLMRLLQNGQIRSVAAQAAQVER